MTNGDMPEELLYLRLTKREQFAAMAMQGLLAHGGKMAEDSPEVARMMAEALLQELDE